MEKSILKLLKAHGILLIISFIFILLSVFGFYKSCEGVRENVLRMHVIANSNSKEDQALKLKVRDAVLEKGSELFDGSLRADDAKQKLEPKRDELIKTAKEVIKKEGYNYPVTVDVVNEYFATRAYGKMTMPAGKYTAIKVVIGTGEGRNWWCVMFPPMCLPAAQKETRENIDIFLDDGEAKVVKSNIKYEPRFKIVELIEEYKNK